VLTAAGAAIWFLGDVPNRLRASRAMREGRVALLSSDLPTALRFFREAALARPTAEPVVQQYDQTQTRWVEMVQEKFAKLTPEEAYLALQKLPPTEPLLVEPHLGRFRAQTAAITAAARTVAEQKLAEAREQVAGQQFDEADATLKSAEPLKELVPEFAAVEQQTRDAQLAAALAEANDSLEAGHFDAARAALQASADAADQDDYAGAIKHLDHAAELKVLADDVAKARTDLRERAHFHYGFELARGVANGQREAVEKALADGHRCAGWASVSADSLLQPTTLTDFLAALETCGLGPKAMEHYIDRLDIPIVVFCREKFPADAVESFLREGFVRWSRFAVDLKYPGLALFLDEQAQTHGAPADDPWRATILAQAIESTHVAVTVADPAPDAEAPAGMNASATAALRKSLKEKLTTWPKYVDYDAAQPVTVVLSGTFNGLSISDDDSDVVHKTVRYQSGTRQVPNPEEQSIHDEYEELLERRNSLVDSINEKQSFVDQVNSNPNADNFTRSQATDRAIEIATDRMLVSQWNNHLRELRQRGQSLPRSIDEPVYDDEPYRIINHVYTCTLSWRIDAALHGATETVSYLPKAGTIFRTEEVAGDASHGVPVRAPQAVPREKLTKALVAPLVASAAKIDELLAQLPALTLQSFVAFHEKTPPAKRADQFLALAYAWEAQQQKFPAKADVFAYAEQVLSLK
jgi:hypothetical protein